MKIKPGRGTTKYGTGIDITLNGKELASAVDLYLVSQGVTVVGARTITYKEKLLKRGLRVYVDPSGHVIDARVKNSEVTK